MAAVLLVPLVTLVEIKVLVKMVKTKHWMGRWLVGVSVIHTLFALVVFPKVLISLLQRGLFNTVGTDPMAGAVVWFVLFGVVLFMCGLAVSALEKSSSALPRALGWSLLALAVLGVVLMPASGFWLIIPPAVTILWRKSAGAVRHDSAKQVIG